MKAGALLLLGGLGGCGGAEQPANDVAGATILSLDRIEMTPQGARYTAQRDGAKTQIDFAVPRDRIAPERAHFANAIGTTEAGVVVMQDDYASRPEQGRCEDGIESFVRVFSLPERRELLAIPAASCREQIGAETTRVPSVTWAGEGRFRIEGQPARTFAIEGSRVTELKGA